MWLIKASLRNPFMVLAFVLMIVFMGYVSLRNIAVDILPVFKAPAVQVLTYFQGMPAASIEKTITNRIERWVNQAPGADVVESKSVPGVSVVKTYFRDDQDPNAALTVTTSLAQGTLPTLPPNTLPPVVLPFDPTGTMPLCILTVESPHMDEAHLKDVARVDVRNMLGAVKGCVAPVVIGGKDRTILIYLDPERLEARHLSPLDVVNALQKGNIMVTPGTAYFGKTQILLDTNVMVDRIEELNNFPIVTERGHAVFLRDVGEARDSYAIQTSRVRISSAGSKWVPHRQVYVPVYRQQGASTVAVVQGVRDAIPRMTDELRARYNDPDIKLDLVMDQSVYVHEAIHSLIEEGIIGAALVSVMILVFLGNWRMTLIASLSIPLAILAAVSCLYATGNTINAMTLGGLALAIGPLVNDAIVALENTHRHMHLGKSSLRAAFDGSVEVMVPVLVATCTTSIVLSPLALMTGMGGFLFRPLALAVAFAMFASFLLSLTFVPMMCAKFLPDLHRGGPAHAGHEHHGGGPFGRAQRQIERSLEGLTWVYERLLGWALRRRALVLTTVGLLFVGSLGLTFGIGQEFFPQVDAGQITVYLRSPSYMRLDASEQRVAEVERFVKGLIPAGEREMIVAEMGLDPDWSSAYSDNSGQQDTVLRIQLNERRRKSAQEYAVELRHRFHADPRFHDLRVSCNTGGMVSMALNYGASSPIDVQVAGGKLKDAFALAKKVRDRVAGVRGAADVRILQRLDAPYMVINVDRQKAGDMGLSAYDVIEQAVAAINSSVSIKHNFWIDTQTGNQYFVGVQFPESPKMTLGEVRNIDITGPNQPSPVKLSQVADIKPSSGAVEINHVSLYRVFNVQVNTEGRDIAGVAKDVIGRLRGLQSAEWARAAAKPPQAQPIQARLPGAQAVHVAPAKAEAAPDGRPPSDGERGAMAFPGGMRVELKGEYGRMNDSFSKLMFGLAAASVLVYLLQVALFRSWVGPFIIMFTVPLGLIGVLTMLYLTRTTLNVQSEMGVIFLVGIAVNNGVLLVEFANNQRRLGADCHKAIITAAAIRFRPILMTFLATFLDLIPMAIGLGKGSEANVPLARAVVGGLLTSTCLTLFVVPILYTLLMKKGRDETDIEAELAGEPPAGPVPRPALAGAAVGGGAASPVPAEPLHPHVLEGPVQGGYSPAPPEPWPEGPAPPPHGPGRGPPPPT